MRSIKALSFSSFALSEKDICEFYTRYLADHRPARTPQERPAAAGSAFDAYVKADLHATLFGRKADPQFEFETIFESQVEPHNRDWAREAGQYLFNAYTVSGAYGDLADLLGRSIVPPRFEFAVEGLVDTVPFLGKPDCRFVLPGPVHVVHDFKVSGFCSKNATSPSKGYMLCRDGFVATSGIKASRGAGLPHPSFVEYDHRGLKISQAFMEYANKEWADQLCLYAWLLGEEVGDENVVLSVDQLVAKPADPRPLMRCAQFRARVSSKHQYALLDRVKTAWRAITSGHIFAELSREENDAKCAELEEQCIALASNGSAKEDFFNQCVRPAYRG